MFNLQPGQGLGFSASKQMAFGLGTLGGIVEAVKKTAKDGGAYLAEKAKILREDVEMLETIIQSFIAGIFDDDI
ncbi:MAG: hypothetical protein JRG81_00030 [Deltaproteobacteria bacterium]|nr:hypothetical protein [Deltaproteobacteria bacterium]MBW2363465.1 hypothetical protein [Deltaproteobacteria bacterium]